MMPGVRVRRLASNPDLPLPSRQTLGSAGYDVSSAEPYFDAVGAQVARGGNAACYVPTADRVHIPHPDQFARPSDCFSTLAHDPLTAPRNQLGHPLGGHRVVIR